jgi:tRNA pseudouridine55 synthase
MNGVLLIDKDEGMSSFDVVRELKRKFCEPKIGHLGTLDPLATGLLVVFLGQATKLIPYFSELEKEYVVNLELGKISDTFDRTGIVKTLHHEGVSRSEFEVAVLGFLGKQWQIQPPFSAIHFQGKRAYEHAREGRLVDLGKRQVTLRDIKILNYEFPNVELNMVCSSGTYVRATVHELGQQLSTGAIMTALRRKKVGKFSIEHSRRASEASPKDLINPLQLLENYLDKSQFAGKEYEYLSKRCQSLLDE